jgi:hypothetical protein
MIEIVKESIDRLVGRILDLAGTLRSQVKLDEAIRRGIIVPESKVKEYFGECGELFLKGTTKVQFDKEIYYDLGPFANFYLTFRQAKKPVILSMTEVGPDYLEQYKIL